MTKSNEWQPWIDLFPKLLSDWDRIHEIRDMGEEDRQIIAAAFTCAKYHPDAPRKVAESITCALCVLCDCELCSLPSIFEVPHCTVLESYQLFSYEKNIPHPKGVDRLKKARAACYADAMKIYKKLYGEWKERQR